MRVCCQAVDLWVSVGVCVDRQVPRMASLLILGSRFCHSGVYTLRAFTPDRNASADITLLVHGESACCLKNLCRSKHCSEIYIYPPPSVSLKKTSVY